MNKQKIALFGATGEVGRQLAEEALKRGHSVTLVVRDETELQLKHPNLHLDHPNLKIAKGDARQQEDIARLAKDHDVVIGFHTPIKESPLEHVAAARAYIEGTKKAGVKNLVTVGHAFGKGQGTTQEAYDAYKPVTQAQREALKLFRNETELNWSYARGAEPEKSERNGEYRMSNEILFTHPTGEHKVQPKDFAQALVDEAEKGTLEYHQHDDEEL